MSFWLLLLRCFDLTRSCHNQSIKDRTAATPTTAAVVWKGVFFIWKGYLIQINLFLVSLLILYLFDSQICHIGTALRCPESRLKIASLLFGRTDTINHPSRSTQAIRQPSRQGQDDLRLVALCDAGKQTKMTSAPWQFLLCGWNTRNTRWSSVCVLLKGWCVAYFTAQ